MLLEVTGFFFKQVVGTDHSEDGPPNVPYFREGTPARDKTRQGTFIAETVAAAVASSMTALGSRNQQPQLSTSYNVSTEKCILRYQKREEPEIDL